MFFINNSVLINLSPKDCFELVFIVTEEEFEAKKSFLGWSAIKLWLKSLISCCQTSCHGVASSICELWKCSLSHNLVKSAWILEIFGSRCIRKKRGIFLWSLFCRWTEKNPSDSMKCEKMSLRKSRWTIFNQLLLKIDSHFPPLARPHWKEENQGFLTVYGMPVDNFFTKNPLIGKLWPISPLKGLYRFGEILYLPFVLFLIYLAEKNVDLGQETTKICLQTLRHFRISLPIRALIRFMQ